MPRDGFVWVAGVGGNPSGINNGVGAAIGPGLDADEDAFFYSNGLNVFCGAVKQAAIVVNADGAVCEQLIRCCVHLGGDGRNEFVPGLGEGEGEVGIVFKELKRRGGLSSEVKRR